MPTSARGIESAASRRLRAARIAVPVILVAFFVLSLVPGQTALVLRQFVFLTPVTAAVLSIAAIIRLAPKSAELNAWSLLGMSMAAVWFSEAYFSAYQVYVAPAGPHSPSIFDALNFVAALFVLAALMVATGVTRLQRGALLVFICDLVSMSVVLFVLVFAFWSHILASYLAEWQDAVPWAIYSSVGVIILMSVLWLAGQTRSVRIMSVAHQLVVSLSIFAIGVMGWPLFQTGGVGVGPSMVGTLDSTLVLAGYCLMMTAALTRLATVDGEWLVTMGRPLDSDRMWQSSLVAGVVLVAAIAMGIWAYQLPEGDGERAVLVAAASVAIIAFVARTGFATYETGVLEDTSSIDPITGALNHRAFQDECDVRILDVRRRGIPFVLAVLDLDGFSRVNSLLGHAGGDRALRSVAAALQSAGGRPAKVFRLSGDEFAVVGVGVTAARSMAFAAALLEAVAEIEPSPGQALSASIGIVACDECPESKEDLLRRADAARIWSKYHGKGRVVAYDETIVRALDLEERLRLDEERSFIGIARALVAAADARDVRNYYHSRNVASLAVLLAEAQGLDPQRVRMIEIAAVLHDVGRIAMPDPVMPSFKPGRQSRVDEEHAELGEQLVGSLGIEGLPVWVRAHHERWDGTGFPDGLAGEAIPLEARIIALADAYDGMTAGRRGGTSSLSKSAALQEIDHGIGTRFDPDLAESFIDVVSLTASLGWSDEWPAA